MKKYFSLFTILILAALSAVIFGIYERDPNKLSPGILTRTQTRVLTAPSTPQNTESPQILRNEAIPLASTTEVGPRNNASSEEGVAAPLHQMSYTLPVSNHGTVLDAMETYAASAHFEFKTKQFPGLGVMIEEINGLQNGSGYYWILHINGKKSDRGASTAQVSSGDIVEWKYEKGY